VGFAGVPHGHVKDGAGHDGVRPSAVFPNSGAVGAGGPSGVQVCCTVGKQMIPTSEPRGRASPARRATRREVARCHKVTGACAPLTPPQGGLGSRVWANHKPRRPVELLLRGSVHAQQDGENCGERSAPCKPPAPVCPCARSPPRDPSRAPCTSRQLCGGPESDRFSRSLFKEGSAWLQGL
jgi:hypothetical protein